MSSVPHGTGPALGPFPPIGKGRRWLRLVRIVPAPINRVPLNPLCPSSFKKDEKARPFLVTNSLSRESKREPHLFTLGVPMYMITKAKSRWTHLPLTSGKSCGSSHSEMRSHPQARRPAARSYRCKSTYTKIIYVHKHLLRPSTMSK